MRLAALLISLVVCVLEGCAHGPRIDYCPVDSRSGGLQCSDYKGNSHFLDFKSAENFSCLSPTDLNRLLAACRKYSVDLTYCIVTNEIPGLACSDADGNSKKLSFEEADNYVCASPRDQQRLLSYCKTKPDKSASGP